MAQKNEPLVNPREKLFVENLKDFKEIFDNFGIKFWLDWGTLLGAVRDKKIIPWDEDMDLGVRSDNYKKIILTFPEFKEKGFLVNEMPLPSPKFPCTKFSFKRFGCVIDIFSYCFPRNENNIVTFNTTDIPGSFPKRALIRYLWLLWRLLLSAEMNTDNKLKLIGERFNKYCLFLLPQKFKNYLIKKIGEILMKTNKGTHIRQIILPRYYFERLESMDFYGAKFNIPSSVESYLERIYGKDWKKPVKDWRWTSSSFVLKNNE